MASLSTCLLELVVWDGNLVKSINSYKCTFQFALILSQHVCKYMISYIIMQLQLMERFAKSYAEFLLRAGTRVIYPAIVEEGRVLLSLASANDWPAFALNIAASTSQGGQRLLMITTRGNKTAPVNECNFASINGSF